MRVLEVNIDDLNFGGVFSLIKNVVENAPSNVNIDIATIEGFQKEENKRIFENKGSRIIYIGCNKNKIFKQLCVYINLKKYLKENHYDAVHIHADTANKLLVSGLAAKKAGTKSIILHAHASGVEGNHRRIKKMVHVFCRTLLPKIGTKFVVCSDTAKKWMFPSVNETILVKNGINLQKFRFDVEKREHVRRELHLSNEEILIGHVGRFAYPKNHEYLLKIAQELKKENANFKMMFVGNGELESEIKKKAAQVKVEDKIIFYGTTTSVQDLFQAMDVFALPSIYEGFPIVGVEAQASGLPVVISSTLTKDAKLIDHVKFLDITDKDIHEWCRWLLNFAKLERKDTYLELVNQQFDITDTINSFVRLYQ
jgi:glycosyltransferase involved in cell wall biosynthesis